MSSHIEEGRIILNVGGIKTYRTTLTAYPDTLLGTMFQERNKELLRPNGNEYFFDRNGKAFHYIMEYYRTGKILWLETNSSITKQELKIEMDFFQIPCPLSTSVLHHNSFPTSDQYEEMLQDFIESLIACIYETSWNLRSYINIFFYSSSVRNNNHDVGSVVVKRIIGIDPYIEQIEKILEPFRISGYELLKKFELDIEEQLKKSIQELIDLEISHQPKWSGYDFTISPYYSVTVKLQSPIYKNNK
ncbi:7550_t:CDS:2 [Funneliformis geosporum]|uniref:7550_t:CDS:1 n=1 Tax=Funneliformis geosporum TaxID=1117311 RepID=A0A9W4WP53_9GLOM|nr:7550_t:CDS:2 [Funneliformis geosporum]